MTHSEAALRWIAEHDGRIFFNKRNGQVYVCVEVRRQSNEFRLADAKGEAPIRAGMVGTAIACATNFCREDFCERI